jgi:hypothetical protein
MIAFLYKGVLCSFSLITFQLCNFWQNNIGVKAACKMLVKLTTDCIQTIYQQTVSAQPFRRCDERNIQLSDMCNMNFPNVSFC